MLRSADNYLLLGKIYSDLGDICIIQKDYDEGLKKYQLSIQMFLKSPRKVEASYRVISIGKVYHFKKEYARALYYYRRALKETTNSYLCGFAYQEIGVNYYWARKMDSAEYFLRKSLDYPYLGNHYSIRCVNLADLYFDLNKFDSAHKYASLALRYPSTFYNQRDSYRILANSECNLGNLTKMSEYLSKYQNCNDSLRIVETQTKYTVLADIHENAQEASLTKKYLFVLAWVLPLLIVVGFVVYFELRKRDKGKEKQLYEAEMIINEKQVFLIDNLKQLIIDQRNDQASKYKKASLVEREQMNRELYIKCLHFDDWGRFRKLMNSTFDNIILYFESNHPELTKKELMWCCLFLLDIPNPDIALILNSQPASLYKLKQRLTQKMSLTSTKELDKLLFQFADK